MASGRKKTHEEFVSEVRSVVGDEYTVLGTYIKGSTKIKMLHENCGKEYDVTPHGFLTGRRCPNCRTNAKKTTEKFREEVRALVGGEYIILDEYDGADTAIKIKHMFCGAVNLQKPSNFLSGKRCKQCAKGKAAKTRIKSTEKIFLEKMKTTEFIVVSAYRGSDMPVTLRHKCGREVVVNAAYASKVLCPRCTISHSKKLNSSDFREYIKETRGSEYELLGEYTNAHEKTAIRHVSCGFVWHVTPSKFKEGTKCPKCSKVLPLSSDRLKEFIKEAGLSDEYQVLNEFDSGKVEAILHHNTCGSSYSTKAIYFRRGSRCPVCNESKGERAIRVFLQRNYVKFKAQEPLEGCVDKQPLPFDFVIKNHNQILAIEFDGEEHYKPIEFFGGLKKYADRTRKDAIKTQYCADNGIPLIRIPYWDFDNIDAILTEKLLPMLNRDCSKLAS